MAECIHMLGLACFVYIGQQFVVVGSYMFYHLQRPAPAFVPSGEFQIHGGSFLDNGNWLQTLALQLWLVSPVWMCTPTHSLHICIMYIIYIKFI